ncbi:MAG: HAMP domain-containing protein [Thermodesulfobacteriota bacterium]
MRLGISCKLIFAQGLALVFFILLAVISYYSIASYSSIHNKDIELANRMESVGDLQLLLERSLMPPNDYLISGNPGERDDYAAIVLEMAVLLERVAAPKNVPEEEARTVDELKKGIIDLEQSAMVLLSTENPVGNKEAASLMKELDARVRLLGRKAEKLHTRIRSDMAEHRRYATQIGERLIKLFYLVALVFLGGIIFLVFMVRKGVIAPIHSLKNAVNIIAQGNLDYNVDIRTGDEIEVLGEEFNKMARSLKVKKMESVEHLENLRRTNCLLDQNILRLYTLYNISKTLSSTLEAEKLFDQIVTEVQQSHSIQRISIMMVDNERGLIQIIAGVGFSNEAKKTTFKLQEGLYGWAAMRVRQ